MLRKKSNSKPCKILEEIVMEILVRLPVKAILRFKSVCKAWHAIISHPSFKVMHLQQSTSRHTQQPSFLITPHAMDMKGLEPGDLLSYQWREGQEGDDMSQHVYASWDFAIDLVYGMSHCDGLLLLLAHSGVYVINPATRDSLMLPNCHNKNPFISAVGMGLDPRSNKYKVACYFNRSVDVSNETYDVGMEVFTVGGSCWREAVEVPPYPLLSFQVATYSKASGSLFWHIYKDLLNKQHRKQPPQGILRFSLDDEVFSFIPKPYLELDEQPFRLVELGDQLCLAQYLSTKLVIWVLTVTADGANHMWHRRHVMNTSILWGIYKCRRVAIPLTMLSNDGILVRYANHLFRFNLGNEDEDAKELMVLNQMRYSERGVLSNHALESYFFDVVPFIESLVPLRT